jgi:ElaB/YqjD/DUF883 family membrane-anchored ribosome-binding protein
MKNRSNVTAQTPRELIDDLHALVAEAEKMMGDSISETTDGAIAGLRNRFDAARERLGELYDGARTKVVAGAKYTDGAIRANPYRSLAIAAGIGLLVGVLWGRRSE